MSMAAIPASCCARTRRDRGPRFIRSKAQGADARPATRLGMRETAGRCKRIWKAPYRSICMRAAVLLVALLLSLAAPARAADITSAQNVIRSQQQAFARNDAAAAYSYAAPAIQEAFPHAEIFMQMVQ